MVQVSLDDQNIFTDEDTVRAGVYINRTAYRQTPAL